MQPTTGKRERGFSLLELLITLVIVAILASIAYPLYQGQVRKARRSDGMTFLQELAQRQERYFSDRNQYAMTMDELYGFASGSSTRDSPEGWYSATIMGPRPFCGPPQGCYRLRADPQGAHREGEPSLLLWSTGRKQHQWPGGATVNGWDF
jgi:type IV pilus assembly protein PilE